MGKSKLSVFETLTTKQQLFVKEYIVDLNATRAAIESGSPKRTAQVQGSKLLAHPKVAAAIAEALRPLVEEAELTTKNVLRQLYGFLFYDVTPHLDRDGFLTCDPKELPEPLRQCIVGVKGHKHYDPETGEVTDHRFELKMVSKDAALKLAMQYLKLLEPDVNINLKQDFWAVFYAQTKQPAPVPIETTIKELAVASSGVVEGKSVSKESNNGHC